MQLCYNSIMMKDVCNMIFLWIWSDNLLYLLSVIYLLAVVVSYLYLYSRRKAIKEKRIENANNDYKLLCKGILSNAIKDAYGFDNVYKRYPNVEYETFVRDFLHYALENMRQEEYGRIEDFVRQVEKERNQKNPFDDCAPSDKQYFLSINEVVAHSDSEAAKHGLRELARSFREKTYQLQSLKMVTIISTVLTVAGLLLNIFLGVRGLSNDDMARIKDVTREEIVKNPNDSIFMRNDSVIINKLDNGSIQQPPKPKR